MATIVTPLQLSNALSYDVYLRIFADLPGTNQANPEAVDLILKMAEERAGRFFRPLYPGGVYPDPVPQSIVMLTLEYAILYARLRHPEYMRAASGKAFEELDKRASLVVQGLTPAMPGEIVHSSILLEGPISREAPAHLLREGGYFTTLQGWFYRKEGCYP